MIDEIKALMPLLEQISEGALWAFLIFMFVKALGIIIWPISAMFIMSKVVVTLPRIFSKGPEDIDLYNFTYEGSREGQYVGKKEALSEFLNWAKKGSTYVHSSDLKDIMEWKRT